MGPVHEPSPIPRPDPGPPDRPSEEEIRYIVAHGVLAPSGGNSQPWRFAWRGGRLLGSVDPGRSASFLDYGRSGSYLALGAAAENMDLAARALGLRADVAVAPEPEDPLVAFAMTFAREDDPSPQPPPLFEQVPLRLTNRRLGRRAPLAGADVAALADAAQARGARLQLLTDDAPLKEAGAILGRGDRLLFLNERGHRGVMAEMRWTRREAEATRDGLDVATLGLSPADRAALGVLSSWRALALLRRAGLSGLLEGMARKAVAASGGVGLLSVAGAGPASYVRGGRAVQRVWLTATALGLAFHPMTALPYLFARLGRGAGEGLSDGERHELRALRDRYARLFDVPAGDAEALLFRIGRAPDLASRSLRRPLAEVLSFG